MAFFWDAGPGSSDTIMVLQVAIVTIQVRSLRCPDTIVENMVAIAVIRVAIAEMGDTIVSILETIVLICASIVYNLGDDRLNWEVRS